MYTLILIVAVIATYLLAYKRGAKHGEKIAHAENMGAYIEGYNKGKADGYKQGEDKGRHEGFSDGQRYAMTIEHNRRVLAANGIINEKAN